MTSGLFRALRRSKRRAQIRNLKLLRRNQSMYSVESALAPVCGCSGIDGADLQGGRNEGESAHGAIVGILSPSMIAKGTRFGAYEVIGPIGAGGMGEVYRARDTRLDRTVAIKLLHVGAHPLGRERFQREARAISALNHPNICTLYDVGHENGSDFLVMEHLEGETLADRIVRAAPLPLPQVLKIGGEIAQALERAHAAGIVHRDLKPGNVMITATGAKLLDFGLAKVSDSEVSSPASATMRQPLTEEGTVLGTLQYMAPEQVEGAEATPRSDIFALGVILYEMATGRRAFEGKSRNSLIAAILESDPRPMSELRTVPPLLEEIVRKCLEKDPAARWESAHDVRMLLDSAAHGVEPPRAAAGRGVRIAWIAAALATVAAIVLGALLFRRPVTTAATTPIRFTVAMPPGTRLLGRAEETLMAVSPDGRNIAIAAATPSGRALWVRPIDSLEARLLPGTDGARGPFWSPDSTKIGFFADGKLKIAALDGAPPRVLPIAGNQGAWSGDTIVAVVEERFWFMDARTGTVRGKPSLGVSAGWIAWPQLLPDGKHLLVTYHREPDQKIGSVQAMELDGSHVQEVVDARSRAEYASGKIYYVRDGALLAQPFDPSAGRVIGEPVVVTPSVSYFRHTGVAAFSVSADGRVIAFQSASAPSQLTWFDRSGRQGAKVGEVGDIGGLRISPEGRRVIWALSDTRNNTADLWITDLDRNVSSRFTNTEYNNSCPVWSPDGRTIAYASDKFGPPQIVFKAIDSTREYDSELPRSDFLRVPTDWSPENRLLLTDEGRVRLPQLWALHVGGDPKPQQLRRSSVSDMQPTFSPDRRWIAFTSNESGTNEVYVMPADGGRAPLRVSSAGGREPVWRRDGRELFLLDTADRINAVAVTGAAFGPSVPLFEIAPGHAAFDPVVGNSYDVAPDGQRFLVNQAVNGGTDLPLIVIVNGGR
jgi:Tol biopolymer transport system component